ncbi:hypothetical protein TNCV_530801 [Trichonephila clavipes]|nr:hypothetical protein TNCV_530801 [Trichonephila clavipes]
MGGEVDTFRSSKTDNIHPTVPSPPQARILRITGLKVYKSNGLLLRNHPSECNELLIGGLETPSRIFGSGPIGRTCVHYSAVVDDTLITQN